MKDRIMLVGFGLVLILSATLGSTDAQAHFHDSPLAVDDNRTLRYFLDTRWPEDARWAAKQWNRVNRIYGYRGVRLIEDNDNPALIIEDSPQGCHKEYNARYDTTRHPHRLYVNPCVFERKTEFQRRNAFVHELGHALGLDHPPETPYYQKNSIMVQADTARSTPGPHDIRDYRRLWLHQVRGRSLPCQGSPSIRSSPTAVPAMSPQ